MSLREKCPNTEFFGPYFAALGLNTERYFVSLRIQSECEKIQTRKNPVFGHFSRSVYRDSYICQNFWRHQEPLILKLISQWPGSKHIFSGQISVERFVYKSRFIQDIFCHIFMYYGCLLVHILRTVRIMHILSITFHILWSQKVPPQPAVTCSKLTIEILEQDVNFEHINILF